jgi:hypothetical protein
MDSVSHVSPDGANSSRAGKLCAHPCVPSSCDKVMPTQDVLLSSGKGTVFKNAYFQVVFISRHASWFA